MELTRFDGYFEGKAPIDTIILRYVTDPNTVLANILATAWARNEQADLPWLVQQIETRWRLSA